MSSSISREKIDKLADLTINALIEQMEEQKAEGKRVSASLIAAALKLLGQIEVRPGETPVLPDKEEQDWEKVREEALHKAAQRFGPTPFLDGKPNPAYRSRPQQEEQEPDF